MLVLENEADLLQFERELRDIQLLDSRGVTDAGKLPVVDGLQAGLKEVSDGLPELMRVYDGLEDRTTALLDSYNHYVRASD